MRRQACATWLDALTPTASPHCRSLVMSGEIVVAVLMLSLFLFHFIVELLLCIHFLLRWRRMVCRSNRSVNKNVAIMRMGILLACAASLAGRRHNGYAQTHRTRFGIQGRRGYVRNPRAGGWRMFCILFDDCGVACGARGVTGKRGSKGFWVWNG